MKISIDDPKLTAFALGELQGPEAEEMRLFVENNEEAKKYVEDIQSTALFLQTEFAREEIIGLKPTQREELLTLGTAKNFFSLKWIGAFSSLAAASLALIWAVRVAEENKIPVVLKITPEMMAAAEKQKPPVIEEAYTFKGNTNAGTSKGMKMGVGYGAGSFAKAKKYVGPFARPPVYVEENLAKKVSEDPLSTFSLDVDTASYSILRNRLFYEKYPTGDDLRIEEMVNYFGYDYASPKGPEPLAVSVEIAKTPWNRETRLLRIAVKAKEIPAEERPASNLVFLMDASGSMAPDDKLPLVKKSLNLLVEQMRPQDRVALVVYAGNAGVYLDSTSGEEKSKIKAAIAAMKADGDTNGSAGIELAYKIANKNFIKNGINRVIIASDGDFNVGISNSKELEGFIAEKAKSGVFLSVLGFGEGLYNDETMQTLANKGNGTYGFIDNLREGRKYLVEQAAGTLMTVAKDVKAQVEFDPRFVSKYRLVGYEKRNLQNEDFRNDGKDAGDVGAGHTVTVFYELTMNEKVKDNSEIGTVKLRYKQPEGDSSEALDIPIAFEDKSFAKASSDFQFAASVVEFSQILRGSIYKGTGTIDQAIEIAMKHTQVRGQEDPYRKEFLEIAKKANDKYKKGVLMFGKGK